MIDELETAQEDGGDFDAEKYVEKWPIKKHDHILIPAGTVHCSGADTVVLEISATPYIFTFKLWDWGRMGLDGKPRPISIASWQRGNSMGSHERNGQKKISSTNLKKSLKVMAGVKKEPVLMKHLLLKHAGIGLQKK